MTHASYTIVGFGVTPPPDIGDIAATLEARWGVGTVSVMRVEFTPPIVSMPDPTLALTKGAMGIDVSRWQGEVDWDAMAASGVKFAGIRATLGTTGVDIQFARNWREAKRVGIARMPYHYFINGLNGLAQFNNLSRALNGDVGEIAPVCDVEPRDISPDPNVTVYETIDRIPNTAEILAWLIKCKEVTARDPLIYTNKFAWDYCTTVPTWSTQYKLWHAQYTTAQTPRINLPWTECAIWQYSRTGNIGGTSPLDLNRWGPYP